MYDFHKYIDFRMPDIRPTVGPKIHPSCQEELEALFTTKSEQMLLKKQTVKRLHYLVEDPKRLDFHKEWYENLGSVQGVTLYSLRYNKIASLGNLRILFIMHEKQPMFLCAFKEKRKGDYEHPKKLAIDRLQNG